MYKFIDHTADTMLEISGNDEKALFKEALKGMNSILGNEKGSLVIKIELTINSQNMTLLLIDFLGEILTLSHINSAIFREITIKTLTETLLEATIRGYKVSHFKRDIKAVTYHEALIIKKGPHKLITRILFDI